jgi:hypothetical protein
MNLIKGLGLFFLIFLLACNKGPKLIESSASSSNGENNTGIFTGSPSIQTESSKTEATGFSQNLHQVKVLEVLPTDKYVYLRVEEEGEDEYWIATRKQDVSVDQNYFYRGGLLKTQFESKEYNRVFDRVYLVSNIVPVNHSQTTSQANNSVSEPQNTASESKTGGGAPVSMVTEEAHKASVSISELVNNSASYEGKMVVLSGTVTKVNPNIMGRNWIHLKDGSMDEYDLVITSSIAIPEGHEVSLKGTVTLNRDFGAGYSYDILLENAELFR